MDQPLDANPGSRDAVDLLVADHAKVEGLFQEFSDMSAAGASPEAKDALVQEICSELKAHETVENEVFFPAVRDVLRKDDVLGEAIDEQRDAGAAISELSALNINDDDYDSKVLELGDEISEHAEDEEIDVFPTVQGSSIDTTALASEMLVRKSELRQEEKDAEDKSETAKWSV